MAKLCKRRRRLRLEVGFEVRRGSRDVLGRAYERLVPLRTCSLPSRAQATLSEGACDENSASESRFGPCSSAASRPWPASSISVRSRFVATRRFVVPRRLR